MRKLFWTLPLLAGLVSLLGCGGTDPGPLPQPSSPVITSPSAVNVQEFTILATRLAVTSPDGNAVSLSLSGPDAGAFSLTNDGSLRFALPPDFTSPADANRDNVYQVTVKADDTYSAPATRALSITVTACPTCRVSNRSAHVTTDASTFVAENIISSFEFPALMQQQTTRFILTGSFASTTNWNNLEFANAGLAPIAARIGDAAVSTCEIGGAGCDAPTGSITIKDVLVNKDAIGFLMSGGNGSAPVGVQIIYNGATLADYRPNSCGDPVLKGNQHYVYFDVSALIGERIDIKIYDEATAGCGFVAFDHFYQTDTPRGTLAAVVAKPLAPVRVTLEGAVAITNLVPHASFENPVDMVARRGWVATGSFAGATATSWQGTTVFTNAARVGDKAISTCEMNNAGGVCDAPIGTLTSPAFKVTGQYLNFLMHAGGSPNTGLRVLDTLGNVLHTYAPAAGGCGSPNIINDDDWTRIDLTALNGAFVKAQLFDEEAAGCGFISTDHWYQSANAWNPSGNGKNGGTVALTSTSASKLGFNVGVNADAFLQVIDNFDDPLTTPANLDRDGRLCQPGQRRRLEGCFGRRARWRTGRDDLRDERQQQRLRRLHRHAHLSAGQRECGAALPELLDVGWQRRHRGPERVGRHGRGDCQPQAQHLRPGGHPR
jgi:predicted small lipoprotein YifL